VPAETRVVRRGRYPAMGPSPTNHGGGRPCVSK
jgi:hypothetical protein